MNGATHSDAKVDHLLEYLRQSRGFDFTGYKRPSLMRRIAKRMQLVSVANFSEYVDYLEVHPEEFSLLFNTILINVTSFFRDEAAWQCLGETVLPRITAARSPDQTIRIWSAGCASGEEAYTIAMLIAETLGKSEFRHRVKVYATDVDEAALTTARQGIYSTKELQAVPPALREKYFDSVGERYVFNAELRRSVIFGRHDLVQDAPMSRLDLLICRNTLMYFNAETQSRILNRFSYALNPNGFLFLGKAEMLLIHSSLFSPVELKYRIFSRLGQINLRDRLSAFAPNDGAAANGAVGRNIRLQDAAFQADSLPKIVIDAGGVLVLANQQSRELFGIEPRDIGCLFHDLELSYRPVDLRSLIEQAYAERKTVSVNNVERRVKNAELIYLDIHVAPLQEEAGNVIGICISFDDVTAVRKLESDMLGARHEAETVNEELQAANEELQSTNEELETTNEELQSTNEELETTNEELQSTNEELETMNEELQSANEELQTINEELRQRTDELNSSNGFLNSILSSLRGAVAVVDRNINVMIWNRLAEDLWGLRSEEVKGQSLLNLDIGLPVAKLGNALRACISEANREPQELLLKAVTRRGRNITCRVTINPLLSPKGERQGAIVIMEEMGM
jgi:two-component system, chemotaxis family, CheB/CheR fusion protein